MIAITRQKLLLFIATLFLTLNTNAQNTFMDSVMDYESRAPHHIWQGEGDDTIVCYKQSHRNTFFVITGLILIIAAVAIKLLMLNKKTNRILKSKNEIIQEKNKSITDSINYAKRLQNAILPSAETVNEILPEHFILYEPKDIVSGDFYWVSKHESKFMVAAIDCTGHGVPGALLSIVGHNAINQSVNEMGITKPSEVMDSMNTIIKKILHQDKGSDIRDGMDMALCTFDSSNNTLEYCGANNPIYIISEGKLNVIKASKLTVGSLQEDVVSKPENHSIPMKKGESFYIFSDGYADQFGGKDNKKFKTSKMQELLVSLKDKAMPEQKRIIRETFISWRGSNEQVDDVLVIGVRI
jgi:serine phosphatase RsbU (regulator of sigma subunit)